MDIASLLQALPQHDGLLLRVGLCLALAMNGGVYSLAMYLGLREGRLFDLLHQLSYGAALVAVLIGGSVFLRSAWQGLRRGLIHLDLPIAIGIVLSFSGATLAFVQTGEARYADTVTVFIALMITGRWLRRRILERNRRNVLADRARGVRNVVFDKTGTLTTGALRLELPQVLERLGRNEARVLAALSEGSAHPKSRAVAEALAERGVEPLPLSVEEVPGFGVQTESRSFVLRPPTKCVHSRRSASKPGS